MIGNDSIDLSLRNIWRSWFQFRKGKRASAEMHDFQYHLEKNLYELSRDLQNGSYRHGGYRKFIVCDNKRREISVASVRDRVVHRLIYDYLEKIYDKTFIYDAWSCRKGKGLLGAIERAQGFLKRYAGVTCAAHTYTANVTYAEIAKPLREYPPRTLKNSYGKPFNWVWKCDVKKFFDSVDQEVLLKILSLRIKDSTSLNLLKEIIFSFTTVPGRKVGMPIGNLTSQIFANIYLNELDRFVKHSLKARAYLRYGDDFVVLENDLERLKFVRNETICFLVDTLKLQINPKSDKIMKVSHGLRFLGVKIWPSGRTLNRRNLARVRERLKPNNISSYSGLIMKHGNANQVRNFNWMVCEKILND
jgi:retron-type reverse transcriptase